MYEYSIFFTHVVMSISFHILDNNIYNNCLLCHIGEATYFLLLSTDKVHLRYNSYRRLFYIVG